MSARPQQDHAVVPPGSLQDRLRSGRLEQQRLLLPETVELPASQAALVLEQRDALAKLGLEVEGFGGGTLMLSSYPALLGRRSPQELLQICTAAMSVFTGTPSSASLTP